MVDPREDAPANSIAVYPCDRGHVHLLVTDANGETTRAALDPGEALMIAKQFTLSALKASGDGLPEAVLQ